jgi:RNA polymerase sigma-70 factor, ECF subfamily
LKRLALAEAIAQVSDQELVDRARRGDDDAFEQIVRRHSPRVFQVASKFFRQRSKVEDMAQEVFLKAYTQLASYEARGSFEGWLTRIATNTCLNELRRVKRHPEATIADLTEDENRWLEQRASVPIEQRQSAEQVVVASDLADKLLAQMPPDDRLVLTLIDGQDFSTKEVAEMTGWSEAKTKVKAFRARRKMRQAMEKLMKPGKS